MTDVLTVLRTRFISLRSERSAAFATILRLRTKIDSGGAWFGRRNVQHMLEQTGENLSRFARGLVSFLSDHLADCRRCRNQESLSKQWRPRAVAPNAHIRPRDSQRDRILRRVRIFQFSQASLDVAGLTELMRSIFAFTVAVHGIISELVISNSWWRGSSIDSA